MRDNVRLLSILCGCLGAGAFMLAMYLSTLVERPLSQVPAFLQELGLNWGHIAYLIVIGIVFAILAICFMLLRGRYPKTI